MPKITILGSCSFEPYKILAAPNRLDAELYEKDHEKAYDDAFEKVFKRAIEECDFVFIYNPYGIGDHTKRDLEYAKKIGKHIVYYDILQVESPWDNIQSSAPTANLEE